LYVSDDLQGGRRLQRLHGRCGHQGLGHFIERKTRSDPVGEVFFGWKWGEPRRESCGS